MIEDGPRRQDSVPAIHNSRRVLGASVGIPLFIALMVVLWFGFGRNPSNIANPLVDRQAPDFSLRATDGRVVNLRSFRGRAVVLNFFASWCTSCQEQEANLTSAYRRWDHQATFLGVIYQDSASAAAAFTRSHGGHWLDLVDPGSRTAVNYGLNGVPETYFINREGRIVAYSVTLLPSALQQGIVSALRT